jgi:hypothetical protein
MPQGGVPDSGPSLGRQTIHATVPDAYYADQGYRFWAEGRYGWSIASHAASFAEAGLGVFTLGTSTRYLAAAGGTATVFEHAGNHASVIVRSGSTVHTEQIEADNNRCGRKRSACRSVPYRFSPRCCRRHPVSAVRRWASDGYLQSGDEQLRNTLR